MRGSKERGKNYEHHMQQESSQKMVGYVYLNLERNEIQKCTKISKK